MIKKGKYIAVRPEALIEARYNLNSSQNDIMDIVLSEIENDNNHLYELNVNDYKKLYKSGACNIYRDLRKAVKSMEGAGFYLINKNDKGIEKETFFVWFASIDYLDKEGKIIVEVGQRLKGLLVEMKKRIYYKLEYPINFRSIYSKRIYYYLKSFEDTKWRIDNLDTLRKKLQCPESYNKYSFFKNKVLDMALEEINNYSDIKFTYEPIKKGRKVINIKFNITSNKVINEIAATSSREDPHQDLDEVKEVQAIFYKHKITKHEANYILKDSKGNMDLIKQCYEYLLSKNKIDNVVGYMRKLVKGFNKPQGSIKTDNFNNCEQRTYDFADLEKKLLGWNND